MFYALQIIEFSEDYGKRIKICNDAGPRWAVNKYLNAILRYYNKEPIGIGIRLRFRTNKDGESSAHNLAKKVMKGRRKEDVLITKKDVQELEDIIRKII